MYFIALKAVGPDPIPEIGVSDAARLSPGLALKVLQSPHGRRRYGARQHSSDYDHNNYDR
jgi:hypothetical protein